MASYDDWNRALVAHFVEGMPRGASIYLNVDDETLRLVNRRVGIAGAGEDPVDDFRRAIQARVVDRWADVDPGPLYGRDGEGYPRAVAFLGLMVLAASNMAEEADISQIDYFTRLRGLLDLSGEGRPPGMAHGAEELLWQAWASWLQERGFLPSARPGAGGTRYIAYPISQALLRQADRDRLIRLFREKGWAADWDVDTVVARVREEAGGLTKHLREVLAAGSPQRLQAIAEAVFDVYERSREDLDASSTGEGRALPATLLARLYRVEDPLTWAVDYYVLPRQRRGRGIEEITVRRDDALYTLREERPGWYDPLGPITEQEITDGARYSIVDPLELAELVLPKRDFWILTPDPENPDSGVYAAWGSLPPGTRMILLCRPHLKPQLCRLSDERLIRWAGDPMPLFGGRWLEVRDCMVTSQAWSGVFIEDNELYETLRPRSGLNVSLSGGLRAPGLTAWLNEYGPDVTVFGFEPSAEVTVVRIGERHEHVVFDGTVDMNKPRRLEWPGPGDYRVEASSGAEPSSCLVRIVGWDELVARPPDERQLLDLGHWRVCGALVEPVDEPGAE